MQTYYEKIRVIGRNKTFFAREGFTRSRINPIIRKAWLEVWDSFYLYCEAKKIPDQGSYLEIGTWRGGSLICAFLATKLVKTSVDFIAIDIKINGNDFIEIMKRISDVRFILLCSDLAKDRIQDDSIDLLFIDGDHYYHQVKRDIMNYWPKIKIGGTLLGHDYSGHELHHGVVKATNEIFGERLILMKNSRIFKVKKISKELR